MSRVLTEEEFLSWKSDPRTAEVMKLLHAKREELRQAWEGGSFGSYDKDETVLINVGNVGTCRGYAYVTDLTYEQYTEDLKND